MTLLLTMARAIRIVGRRTRAPIPYRQRGTGLLALSVAGTLAILFCMAVLQFAMLYVARHRFNRAVFIAARTGALAHANIETIQQAYLRALIPLYVEGRGPEERIAARIRAKDAVAGTNDGGENPQYGYARIVLESPTRENFSVWNSPILQYTIGAGSRVIPHSPQAHRTGEAQPGADLSFRQANLMRLHVIHGYRPTIPWVGWLYQRYLVRQDNHSDSTYSDLLGKGLIPLVTTVTLPMQSDAIERLTVPRARALDCTSLNAPDGCLPSWCLPGNIRCDPACKPPSLCSMPALPED